MQKAASQAEGPGSGARRAPGAPDLWNRLDQPGSHPSGSAVADGDLVPLHDDRHLALAARRLEHGLHGFGARLHVDVIVVPIGLTGPLGVGSTGFAVDHYPLRHCRPPFEPFVERRGPLEAPPRAREHLRNL